MFAVDETSTDCSKEFDDAVRVIKAVGRQDIPIEERKRSFELRVQSLMNRDAMTRKRAINAILEGDKNFKYFLNAPHVS